jgi:hypothetical protein
MPCASALLPACVRWAATCRRWLAPATTSSAHVTTQSVAQKPMKQKPQGPQAGTGALLLGPQQAGMPAWHQGLWLTWATKGAPSNVFVFVSPPSASGSPAYVCMHRRWATRPANKCSFAMSQPGKAVPHRRRPSGPRHLKTHLTGSLGLLLCSNPMPTHMQHQHRVLHPIKHTHRVKCCPTAGCTSSAGRDSWKRLQMQIIDRPVSPTAAGTHAPAIGWGPTLAVSALY